jgi:hypothetical protein
MDLSGVFAAAFSPIYEDAVLHRRVLSDTNGSISAAETDHPCKAQLDSATEAMRRAEGFAETDQRIIVLRGTLDIDPGTDDEISLAGRRWKIAGLAADPARTHWELRGRRG